MKKKFLTVALAATMVLSSVVPTMAESDLENGLVGYYTFDDTLENAVGAEGAKATMHNGADANEDTTNDWAAASTATPTYATGKNNKGLSFSGDGGTVHKGEGVQLDVKTTEAFTISLWANTAERIDFQPVVFVESSAADYINIGTQFNSYYSGALVMINDWTGTPGATWIDNVNYDIPVNTWTYITLTMTADGTVTLYNDGEVVKTTSLSSDAYTYDSDVYKDKFIYLGVNWWNDSFKGTMDDVAIYNRALSATEVADLYEANGVIEISEPTPEESEISETTPEETPTQTGDMTTVLPVVVLAVAAMVVVVVMRKRTVTN